MRTLLMPFVALLTGTAILLMGHGMLSTLVPIRAEIEGFGPVAIGVVGAAYFAGFMAGCFFCPPIIGQVGHIRAFTAFAGLAAAIPMLHVLGINVIFWIFLRALTGLCFAGLYMVIESWLNDRATPNTRGRIVSIYVMVNMVSMAAGNQFLSLSPPADFKLFAIGAILISLALIPVALTRSVSPPPPVQARPRIRRMIALSPVGFFGCIAVGVTNGTFWSLGPLYGQALNFDVADIALFMSLAILGGALAQWPVGWISDHSRDRRRQILGVTGAAAVFGLLLAFGPYYSGSVIFIIMLFFGAMIFPLYGLCVAHANDYADSSEFVDVSASLLLAYGVGATAGPLLASAVSSAIGPTAIFGFTALAHMAFGAYVVWRIGRRAAVPVAERADYVPVSRTSATIYSLDPRAPEEHVSNADPEAAAGENADATAEDLADHPNVIDVTPVDVTPVDGAEETSHRHPNGAAPGASPKDAKPE